MENNLLIIANSLLSALERFDFVDVEREYIIQVIRKIVFVLIIDLSKKNMDT